MFLGGNERICKFKCRTFQPFHLSPLIRWEPPQKRREKMRIRRGESWPYYEISAHYSPLSRALARKLGPRQVFIQPKFVLFPKDRGGGFLKRTKAEYQRPRSGVGGHKRIIKQDPKGLWTKKNTVVFFCNLQVFIRVRCPWLS